MMRKNKPEERSVKEVAAAILSVRPYAVAELYAKLEERDFDPNEIEETIALFLEMGFLDDAAYAATLVSHYQKKGYGSRRIQQELTQRGVDREVADEALEALEDPAQRIDRLVAVAIRRAPLDVASKRRLVASLQRKGFLWEDIRDALSRAEADVEDE